MASRPASAVPIGMGLLKEKRAEVKGQRNWLMILRGQLLCVCTMLGSEFTNQCVCVYMMVGFELSDQLVCVPVRWWA